MATNANYNKVVYGNNTLIDLSGDTVTAEKLLTGETAHDSTGALIIGNAALVNGSEVTYTARSNVTAGDFVKIGAEAENETSISSLAQDGRYNAVCELSNNKFFLVFKGTSNYLWGAIATKSASGSYSILGTAAINSTSYTNAKLECSVIYTDENYDVVLVLYCKSNKLYYALVRIPVSGTASTFWTMCSDLVFSSQSYSAYSNYCCGDIVPLSNGTAFVCHRQLSREALGTAIVSVANSLSTELTINPNITNATDDLGGNPIAVKLDEQRVVVFGGRAVALKAVCATLSGTDITYGAVTTISSSIVGGTEHYKSAVLMDDGTIVVFFGDNDSMKLRAVAVSVSGTTITAGDELAISSLNYSGYQHACFLLNNAVYVLHSALASGESTLYLSRIGVDGLNLTLLDTEDLSISVASNSYDYFTFLPELSTLVYAYSATNLARCADISYGAEKTTSVISGVAKNSANAGQMLTVVVPALD